MEATKYFTRLLECCTMFSSPRSQMWRRDLIKYDHQAGTRLGRFMVGEGWKIRICFPQLGNELHCVQSSFCCLLYNRQSEHLTTTPHGSILSTSTSFALITRPDDDDLHEQRHLLHMCFLVILNCFECLRFLLSTETSTARPPGIVGKFQPKPIGLTFC